MIGSIVTLVCWLLIGVGAIFNMIADKAPFSPFIGWCMWVLVVLYCVINLLEHIQKKIGG